MGTSVEGLFYKKCLKSVCQNACVKKPINNNENGLKNGGNKLYENKG